MSIAEVFQWSGAILFLGLVQANLENLVLCFRYPKINNYPFANSAFTRPYNNWLSFGFDTPGVWIIYVFKLVLSIVMLGQVFSGEVIWYLPILYLVVEFLGFQRQYFLHMSDSPILKILLVSISVHYGFNDEQLSELSIWFISIQISLAYFAAGLHKVKSSAWHNGDLITKLFFRTFHSRFHLFFERNTGYWKWLGWGVVTFELLYPLSLLGGYMNRTILLFGVLFHGFISIGIGINFFLWTFVACYPAVYYTGEQLNQYLF